MRLAYGSDVVGEDFGEPFPGRVNLNRDFDLGDEALTFWTVSGKAGDFA